MKRIIIIFSLLITALTAAAQITTPPAGTRWFGGSAFLLPTDTSVYFNFRTAANPNKWVQLARKKEFRQLTAANSTVSLSGPYDGFTARNIAVNEAHPFNWTGKHTFIGTSSQIRLQYDANNFADITSTNIGNLTIQLTGVGGSLTSRTISMNGLNATFGNLESNFAVASAQSTANTNDARFKIAGATSLSYRNAFGGGTNAIVGTNISYATNIFKTVPVAENTSGGRHAMFANVAINPLLITPGAHLLTNSATLFVNGAASATAVDGNFAIYAIGLNRLDSIRTNRLQLNGSFGSAGQVPRIKADGSAMEWFTPEHTARYTASGDGTATTITVPHGLTGITANSLVWVTPKNAASGGYAYATADATNVSISYTSAPPSGSGNLSYDIIIKP